MSAVAHLFDLVEREAAHRVGWLTVPQVREARAEVVALVDAAKGMRAVTGGGNVCTVTESLAAYHRLDAALTKFEEVA